MRLNSDDDLGSLGRFTNPAVLILSSLAGGDKHGYALLQDIQQFAQVDIGPGTLYGHWPGSKNAA